MDYHIFKKPTKSKNKIVHRWYYYFEDLFTGQKIQKVCKGCKTQAEAYAYVSKLPPLVQEEKITIAKIAENMFLPNSSHVIRLEKLGKKIDPKTLKEKRYKLSLFVKEFGDYELQQLTVPMVINYLIPLEKSGSWKNNFLTVVGNVYDEAPFQNVQVQKLTFPIVN